MQEKKVQTVYVPVETPSRVKLEVSKETRDFIESGSANIYPDGRYVYHPTLVMERKEGDNELVFTVTHIKQKKEVIVFEPKEFGDFLEQFGKELLEAASKNAKFKKIEEYRDKSIFDEEGELKRFVRQVFSYEIDKESITQVLPKFLEQFKVKP